MVLKACVLGAINLPISPGFKKFLDMVSRSFISFVVVVVLIGPHKRD